jgi:beta-glucosidase
LLTDVLKGDWKFPGFVISDASGTGGATVLHMTEASTATATQHAFMSGLDVVFQSSYGEHRSYLDAFRRGLIPMPVIDAAVARVLRAKFELGLFEHPYIDPERAATVNGSAEHRAVARDAARESIVLLKNEGGVLPLAKTIRSMAVIGVDASEARLGGYSSDGSHPVSMLDGLTRALGGTTTVRYAAGPGRAIHDFDVVPSQQLSTGASGQRGLQGEYFDNPRFEGAPRLTRTDARMDFRWTLNSPGRGIPFDWYSVRWSGTITAPAAVRATRVGIEGNDGYRLYLDDHLVIDNWVKRSFGRRVADVALAPGSTHAIRLEYYETTGNARVKLIWDAGVVDDSQVRIDEAVAAARQSDIAVVVAGVEEGEFRDRAKLGLPGRQEDLIRAVAATGRPLVVVLVGGSAITMPWLERASAVIDVWYPGEEGGNGLADVLFGDVSPAGRLPITFPVAEGQLPLSYDHKPTGRGDDYVDLTGQPLFPFGFGLSYTTFEYTDLVIEPAMMDATGTARIQCVVRNTGTRAGDEVVQLYVRDVLASVARPIMELKGFERVALAPGEQRTVTFTLGPKDLRFLNEQMKWVVEPGAFRIMIGASSKDIRLRGQLIVR